MHSKEQLDITGMLAAWSKGDEKALNRVMPLVYDDLRLIARKHLGRFKGQSVQSGTLAHEADLKLIYARGIRRNKLGSFFALCALIIRRILVDHVRKHGRPNVAKYRRSPWMKLCWEAKRAGLKWKHWTMRSTSLSKIDPEGPGGGASYFGGLSVEETAEVLGSEETVTRDWRVAKTRPRRELTRTKYRR